MIRIPVTFLCLGRIPDRDLMRTLAISGPATSATLRHRLRLTADAFDNAMGRLERGRMVKRARIRTGGRPCAILWSVNG